MPLADACMFFYLLLPGERLAAVVPNPAEPEPEERTFLSTKSQVAGHFNLTGNKLLYTLLRILPRKDYATRSSESSVAFEGHTTLGRAISRLKMTESSQSSESSA